MRGFLSVLLVISCTVLLAEGACAESLEPLAAAGKPADDEPAQSPPTAGDRAKHDEVGAAGTTEIEETATPPATEGDHAKRDEEAAAARAGSQAGNAPTAELTGMIDSMCLMLESAAATNGLPLEFFARVIWEESRFQPNTVGPMTRSGHRAQGIAQFMPYTADARGLLDPFNPETALPKAAEFLAELRSEFGNLGLAAAAYNAGPGRVRDFLGGRGGMPAQTRYYVRAVTGRSVDEWAALGREGGKDGIPKPTSCGQLAALLTEQPSFFIGKTRPNVREAASSPQASPDRRNASSGQSGMRRVAARPTGSVATRNRNPLQVRTALLPSTDGANRQPKTSPPAASGRSSATPAKSGKSTGAAARSTSVASMLSDPKSASGRLRAVSPKGSARENSATRVAARPRGTVATPNRNPLQVRTASLPTTDGATRQPKTSPSGGSAESGSSSATPGKSGKSTGAARRSTSVASTLSDSKPVSDRLRAVSPKGNARENSATRVVAHPTGSAAMRNRNPLQVRTASSPTTEGPTRQPKTSPPAASAESGSSSATPAKSGKSTGAAGRPTSVPSTLSDSKSASGRLRAVLPKASMRENSATGAAARRAGSVAMRNALLPTTDGASRQPKSSPPAASGESGSSSAKPGKPAAGRPTSVAATLSDSKSASGRLRAVLPKASMRENSATAAAARRAGSVAMRNALLPTTDGPSRQPKSSPPTASGESGSSSAKPGKPGKSAGAPGRSTSAVSTLSDSKSASGRLRAVSPKGMAQEKADTDRLRKVMQICRGC